ncbi:MAG: hypothetical protein RIE53_01915 [Rhodothermales bacterium]
MDRFDKSTIDALLADRSPPCLSLYQRTHRHHPDNRQDPIRYVNLVSELEKSLQKRYSGGSHDALLDQFRALAEDGEFWNHTLDGLAVLGAEGFFRVFRLPRTVPDLAIAANSFHIKPLLSHFQSADRFHVLGLDRKQATLFEGNHNAVSRVHLHEDVPSTLTEALGAELTDPHRTVASYGGAADYQAPMQHGHGGKKDQVGIDTERFFRAVDKGIVEHHSRPGGLPLILAALPEHQHVFREISSNPNLMEDGIDIHPESFETEDALQEHVWRVMEPHVSAQWTKMVDEFKQAASKGNGTDRIEDVVRETTLGRVDTLMIEAFRENPADPEVEDVLDDLASMVLKKGGQVFVLPRERIPTETGVAAIYRY